MNVKLRRCSLWATLAVIVCIGDAASSDDVRETYVYAQGSTSAVPAPDEELQLLQVQSVTVGGKERAALTSQAAPREIGASDLLLQAAPREIEASDLLGGVTRLFMSHAGAKQSNAQSRLVTKSGFGFNGNHCERRFGGPLWHNNIDGNHGPEVLNTLTSGCIILVGLYQLAAWNHQSAFIRFLCSLVVINGWASGIRHYTNIPLFASMDSMSVLVGVLLGCCFIVDMFTLRIKKNWVMVMVLRVLMWVGMPILFCLCLAGNPHEFDPRTRSSAFRVMFALPLVCVAVGVYGSLWWNWVTWASVDHEALKVIRFHVMIGVPSFVFGALCMVVSELNCGYSPVAQYFPGHAVYHMSFPIGVNSLLLYIVALWADAKRQPMTFYKGVGFKAWWFKLAPAFTTIRQTS